MVGASGATTVRRPSDGNYLSASVLQRINMLGATLADVANWQSERIKTGTCSGSDDRAAALMAIEEVLQFANASGINTFPLDRLHSALVAVELGAASCSMLIPAKRGGPGGRPKDVPVVEVIKARLAGSVEAYQLDGMTRDEAVKRVFREMSPSLCRRLSARPIDAETLDNWVERFGGTLPNRRDRGRINFEEVIRVARLAKAEGQPIPFEGFMRVNERLSLLLPEHASKNIISTSRTFPA